MIDHRSSGRFSSGVPLSASRKLPRSVRNEKRLFFYAGSSIGNFTPAAALESITAQGRSPLTIDEGVAIMTHFADFLMKNNCFSLLASRHEGDQRVPAIWITAEKRPRLGWCWNGNPHTWLGSASAGSRVG